MAPGDRRPTDLGLEGDVSDLGLDMHATEFARELSDPAILSASHQSLDDRRRAPKDGRRVSKNTSFPGATPPLEAAQLGGITGPGAAELSAEFVLRVLAPRHSAAVKARLRRECVQTAVDLAGLDKDDLQELGLTMLERSRVLNWARQNFPVATGRSRSGSVELLPDGFPGTPGIEGLIKDSLSRIDLANESSSNSTPVLQRRFSDHGMDRLSGLLEHGREESGSEGLEQDMQHLDEVESQSDFWFRLVADGTQYLRTDVEQVDEALRRGGDSSGQVQFSDLRENLLEKLFDLSPERLKEVYESIDRDSDGKIKKEELREGLHRCELHGLDGALEKVLNVVGRDNGSLRLDEFESVLTRLKLAQLLSTPRFQHQAAAEQLTILDYNSQKVEERKLSLRDYFFGHRRLDFPMRWVHLRHFDLTLLLSLTVKYQLHPLSVEDVIDQAPTKLDRYEGHYFAAIEHLEVIGANNGNDPVKVRGRHVTLFCAGPPHTDTVITVSQADRSFRQDWPGYSENTGTQEDAWLGKLHKRLRAVRSRVRERRSDFLMYEIIDLCTDDIRQVTRVFTARLNWLEERLQKSKLSSEQGKLDWFNEVGIMRLQLAVVSRRLRGLQRILKRLTDDPDLTSVLTGYLQDVADHVNEAYEDANHLGDKCSTLSAAYEHAEDRAQDKIHRENAQAQTLQDERMNKMLFILTILTTIFTPLTFVAGIYGMNFQDMDGHPTIPELLAPHGYFYFMGFTIVYLVISCVGGTWLWRRVSGSIRRDEAVPGRPALAPGNTGSWSNASPTASTSTNYDRLA